MKTGIILGFILCFSFLRVVALDYYWVNGSGNWSDINHWATTSGGNIIQTVVPSPNDNVIFDVNSGFTIGNNTVTVNVSATCHDITFVGALNTPIITESNTNFLEVYGSWAMQANMVYDLSKTVFKSTNTGETITSNGVEVLNDVEFSSAGGWIFQDDFDCRRLMFLEGNLNTNNQTLTLLQFRSYGSLNRDLILGSSSVIIEGTSSGWEYQGANATINAGTSTIDFINQLSTSFKDFEGDNNQQYHSVLFSNPNPGEAEVEGPFQVEKMVFMSSGEIKGNNSFDTLIFSAGNNYVLQANNTQTVLIHFSASAPPCQGLINLESSSAGYQADINIQGTVALDNLSIKDIQALGNIPLIANSSFDIGNTTNITFPPATGTTLYWVGGTGNWNDNTHWSTVNDGIYPASSGGCVPTPLDDVVFNNNSGFTANNTVTLDAITQYCRDITFVGALNTPTITGANTNYLDVYGSWTMQTNMVYDISKTIFKSTNTGETITSNGVEVLKDFEFSSSGEWTFQDDFDARILTFLEGNLIANNPTLTLMQFRSSGALNRDLILGSSSVIIEGTNSGWQYQGANTTLNAGTSTIDFINTLNNSFNDFRGDNNHQYYRILFSDPNPGIAEVDGPFQVEKMVFMSSGKLSDNNTYDTLIFSAGCNYVLQANNTQTVTAHFSASAPPCQGLINVESTSAGNQAILNIGGSTSLDNLSIKDIQATGNIPLLANSSFDIGNNTNITFPPATGTTLYWVGGTGNWNDNTHWSTVNNGIYPASNGGCVPTPLDDVVFNNNSGFTVGNNVVTLDGITQYCRNITFVGALNTPTIISSNTNFLDVYGSWTMQADMIYDISKTRFKSINTGEFITSNGVEVLKDFEFSSSGEWTFQDAFDCRILMFLEGSLNTNNQDITLFQFRSYGSSNRNLVLGSSAIDIEAHYSGWEYYGNNSQLNAGTSIIDFINPLHNSFRDFKGDNQHQYHHVLFSDPTPAEAEVEGPFLAEKMVFMTSGELRGDNVFDTLLFTAGNNYTLQANTTQTINNKFYFSGNPCYILFIRSSSTTIRANIDILGGSVRVDYVNFRGLDATGSYTVVDVELNSIDAGNNVGFTFAPNTNNGMIGLGADVEVACPFPSLGHTIYTNDFFSTPNTTFLWNDGSTDDTLFVTDYGVYSIIVDYGQNCIVQDSINVFADSASRPVLTTNIVGDSVVCDLDSILYTIQGSSDIDYFIWSYAGVSDSIGSNDSLFFSPDSSSVLSVVGKNICGYSIPEELNILVGESPVLPNSSWQICEGDTISIPLANHQLIYSNTLNVLNNSLVGIAEGTANIYILDTITGCMSDSSVQNIVVNESPIMPTISPNTLCEGSVINLPIVDSTSWLVVNSSIINITNTDLLGISQGTTSISLIDTLSGCISQEQQLTVLPKPSATATIGNEICLSDSIALVGTGVIASPSTISDVLWTTDTYLIDTLNQTAHIFDSIGNYTVHFVVNGTNGCTDTVSNNIVVHGIPQALFEDSIYCLSQGTVFENHSLIDAPDMITDYHWDFGDGVTSNQASEVHYYSDTGNYQVSLVVTSNHNCTDSITKQLSIVESPQVNFTLNDICQNDSLFVVDSIAVGIPNSIEEIHWDFGDGTVVNLNTPNTELAHIYQNSGNYIVTLIGMSSNGCTDTMEATLNVAPKPEVNFLNNHSCINEQGMLFENLTTIQGGGNLSYLWQFNDGAGGSSSIANPVYNYTTEGEYVVELSAISTDGCADSITQVISIFPKPQALFSEDKTAGCPGVCVTFKSESYDSIGITNLYWNFGNGVEQTTNNFQGYCFENSGTYDVVLVAENTYGCFDTVNKTSLIHVLPKPIANFDISPDETTINNALITFSNSSTNALNWIWNFDNGVIDSINYSPEYQYSDLGTYEVELIVFDSVGCSDTLSKELIIEPINNIFIPSAFSPNNDGENDVLYVRGYTEAISFNVFDRWGKEVFFSTNQNIGWDGMINGQKAIEGVYFWYLTVSVDNEIRSYKGDVSLFR